MAITKYTYSILNNTLNNKVSVFTLSGEIKSSSIVIAEDHIQVDGDVLDIYMKDSLSTEDNTTLDNIVSNHVGEFVPQDVTRDSDGSEIIRTKITTSGWSYQLHGVEFETSKLDSIYSKKEDESDYGYTSIKFYDSEGVELTTQASCDLFCVKTVIDWEPNHDYEAIGGMLKLDSVPLSDLRFWVVGVPDVPAIYGGSKVFVSNVNLKYIGIEEGVRADGRAPKYLIYDPVYHTNKLRLVFTHPAGFRHKLHMIFEIFKP